MGLQEAEADSSQIDDDIPTLSAETLKALQEFLTERQEQEKIIDENWVNGICFSRVGDINILKFEI